MKYNMAEWHRSFFSVCNQCKKKGVVLYGAGVWGDIAYNLFKKYDITPLCYADDDVRKQGNAKNDIPVLALRDAKNKYPDAVFIICTEDYMTAESVEQKTRDGILDNLKKENAYSVESQIRLKHYVFLLDIKRSCKDIVLNKENKQDSFFWRDFRKIILFNNMSNSGSYYMEQLLDGHTDILFLPYSGSFKMVYDKRLASLQNEELIVEIMAQMLGYFHSRYESFDCVGQHRYQKFILDEYGNCMNDILIDPEEYMVCLLQQFGGEIKLKSYGHLIKILFAAYNNALHRKKEEKDYWIFYHMHMPNADAQKLMGDFEKDEFDRMESLMIIREPVQHLYSWIRRFVKIEKNVRAVRKPMLEAVLKSELGDMLEIKNMESTYAICFEDLKYRTADTMKSLCKWLDIPYQDQLLETTIQGKQVYFPANTAEGIKYITGNDTSTVRLTCFREVLSLWDETRLNIIYGEFKKAYGYVTSCPSYNEFEEVDRIIFKERFSFCDCIEELIKEQSPEELYDVDMFVKTIYKEYLKLHQGRNTCYCKAIKPI